MTRESIQSGGVLIIPPLHVSPKAEGAQEGVGRSRRSFSKGGTCLAVASAKADLSRRSFSKGGPVSPQL